MDRAERRRQEKAARKAARAATVATGDTPPLSATVRPQLDQALQHHRAGRLKQAEAGYRAVLALDPAQPVALHHLGVIAQQAGHVDAALDLIGRAVAAAPDYAEAQGNLGLLLAGQGRFDAAAESFRRAAAIRPDFADAHFNLGLCLDRLGRPAAAAESLDRALALQPGNPRTLAALGAIQLALGRPENAAARLRDALAADPTHPDAGINLGVALRQLGHRDDAIGVLETAAASHPNRWEAHQGLALALKDLGRHEDAEAALRRAVALAPDNGLIRYNLAQLYDQANRLDDLEDALAEAREHCPGDPRLAICEATLLKRHGDLAAARAVLEIAGDVGPDPHLQNARDHLLAELCDRLGDADAAFAHIVAGNRRSAVLPQAQPYDAGRFRARLDHLRERFTPDWVASWQTADPPEERSPPVFLVGFPRSGTTLLDTILMSHPQVAIVEERPMIDRVCRHLETGHLQDRHGPYPEALATLTSDDIAALRAVYFEELDRHLAGSSAATVVDKFPLNLAEAGLIHRLFPRARFVMTLRHPCDCVLGCLMRNFVPSDANLNFLDLDEAAQLYEKAMALWQQYRAVLPLAVHTVRYEDLVGDFDGTVGAMLEAIGLDWDDAVRDFASVARRRGVIDTPSYDQVMQPIFTRSRGRWARYRRQLAPVLPTLLPWAGRLGYDPDDADSGQATSDQAASAP